MINDVMSSCSIHLGKDANTTTTVNSNETMDNTLVEEFTKRINKELNSKLITIFSSLREVSEVIGVHFPSNDDQFFANTCMIIEGHAEAFKEVENN